VLIEDNSVAMAFGIKCNIALEENNLGNT